MAVQRMRGVSTGRDDRGLKLKVDSYSDSTRLSIMLIHVGGSLQKHSHWRVFAGPLPVIGGRLLK